MDTFIAPYLLFLWVFCFGFQYYFNYVQGPELLGNYSTTDKPPHHLLFAHLFASFGEWCLLLICYWDIFETGCPSKLPKLPLNSQSSPGKPQIFVLAPIWLIKCTTEPGYMSLKLFHLFTCVISTYEFHES